jgi:hypothetical protein
MMKRISPQEPPRAPKSPQEPPRAPKSPQEPPRALPKLFLFISDLKFSEIKKIFFLFFRTKLCELHYSITCMYLATAPNNRSTQEK